MNSANLILVALFVSICVVLADYAVGGGVILTPRDLLP